MSILSLHLLDLATKLGDYFLCMSMFKPASAGLLDGIPPLQ